MTVRALGLAAVLLLAGCGGSPRSAPGEERPERVRATLPVDGEPRTVTLRLYRSPPGFALPFSTYLPEDVRAGAPWTGTGDAVRFVRHSGTARDDSAFVYLFVHPPGTREDAAREVVRTAAERLRIPGDRTELEPVRRHRWALVEYRLRSRGWSGRPLTGWAALGEKDGRWFHLVVQHPVGREDFAPRAERIVADWRWADTGAPLGAPGGKGDPPAQHGGRAEGPR